MLTNPAVQLSAKVLSDRLCQLETYGLLLPSDQDGKSCLLTPTGQEGLDIMAAP